MTRGAVPPELPIHAALPDLRAALAGHKTVVLSAPPGAGKSTIVPLALLAADWLGEQGILLLEPRRLAAQHLAERLAQLSGQPLGQLVGLRTRDDQIVGPATRLEVLTEALLTRRLQQAPELKGVGCVIFDEFHERSLHADLGLALAREVQAGLRDDLRLLLMSATLDEGGLADQLGAQVVRSEGRSFPVLTEYRPPRPEWSLEQGVARAVREALAQESGSVLVFLPGELEIRRCAETLADVNAELRPLYGRLDRAAQQAALRPPVAGQRKLVLATAVAETSLTIEGVRVVIDSGWSRQAEFNPNAGFSRLVTRRVSRDAADQRRGRAGRLEPGVCWRLWSSEEALAPQRLPEMRSADLAPVALNVAAWGSEPPWLEPPPGGAWQQAWDLLQWLKLVDGQRRITRAGRQLIDWGAHPRIGAMLLAGQSRAELPMACDLAALLERDARRSDDDLHAQWLDWRAGRLPGARDLERASARWRRRLRAGDAKCEADSGPLLAAGFPDRVAQRRQDSPDRYQLRNGRGAALSADSRLRGQDYLVVAELAGDRDARIRLAASYALAQLEHQFADDIQDQELLEYNARRRAVEGRWQRRLDALILAEQPLSKPDPAALAQALLAGVRSVGLPALAWTGPASELRARLRQAAAADPRLPAVDDQTLHEELEQWLLPYLNRLRRLDEISPALLAEALRARLDHGQRQRLDELAPRELALPGGRLLRLDYSADEGPVLAVRLQDLIGQRDGPQVAGRPVLLHLLSPARRPLAVTRDLASFWTNAYPEVRKQMRGRYPKHPWPEDPLQPLTERGRR